MPVLHLTNSQIFNRRIAEAGTIFTVGPAVGITDSLCAQAFRYIYKKNQKSKMRYEMLANRTKELDRLKGLKEDAAIAQFTHHGM